MATCSNCREQNPDHARFCLACGASLDEATEERRKIATLLFCDVTGSTALGERVDAESVRELMRRYFAEMRRTIEHHGGTVEKFIGDAVMAVFGVPAAHEDDAVRGLRAAAEMQQMMPRLNEEFEQQFGDRIALRIGVATGEVVAGDGRLRETFVTGDAVNVAARLEQAAAPGETLLDESTYRLARAAVSVEPAGALALKGKRAGVDAYRLLRVAETPPPREPRLRGRMVGRAEELAMLREALSNSVTAATCRLATVLGEAGVGKSRLVAEFAAEASSTAKVLSGRCLSYGEGITFWPIAEIVRELVGGFEDSSRAETHARLARLLEGDDRGAVVAQRVAQAVGLAGGTAPAAEIDWACGPAIAQSLADALDRQDRLEEADEWLRISEQIDPEPDPVRARLLARAGRLEEAAALAQDAVVFAAKTETPLAHGPALETLAVVLERCGRHAEAAQAAEEAVRLHERKGNVVAARAARARIHA